MEIKLEGFTFLSDFDSGNLGRVELSASVDASAGSEKVSPASADEDHQKPRQSDAATDAERTLPDRAFDVWTRPDCQGTSFENGNRTWFYFGIMKDPQQSNKSSYLVRLTVRNLNKQSKLFSQGMVPVFLTQLLKKSGSSSSLQPPTSCSQQWERLKDRSTYWTEDGNFVISFRLKISVRQVTYIAFTYPYTYKELQTYLNRLEKKHSVKTLSYEVLKIKPENSIYFQRENLCFSFENRRVDLLTISSVNNMLPEREVALENLFPGDDPPGDNKADLSLRPFKFSQKKVVFVSARVHPGETQSSFVINGFIKFLLRENDPRAIALRKKYVFKLIPMLNPDGVVNGHYRTDSRGVNLNRVYGSPSLTNHPPIYAARKLLLYSHYGYEIIEHEEEPNDHAPLLPADNPVSAMRWLRSSLLQPTESPVKPSSSLQCHDPGSSWYEMTETSRFSEGDESIADFSISCAKQSSPFTEANSRHTKTGRTSFRGAFSQPSSPRRRLNFEEPEVREAKAIPPPPPPAEDAENGHYDFAQKLASTLEKEGNSPAPLEGKSGLFLYVDIHGHASKRGIFMYGNHFHDTDTKVDSMLLPKLMSINCANFDFPACNFTERNMYLKDRHTGAGREGSGRVSAFKATGLVYSYTLECNFNTGRVVNAVPMASRDAGRATPPPGLESPPKYDSAAFEDAGKAMAVSILDLTESNPWSRLTCSACKNLKGVKEAIKKYIKQCEELALKQKEGKTTTTSASTGMARRSRTISVSSAVGITKRIKASKKIKAPASPESYRQSKVARKNLEAKNSQQSSKPTMQSTSSTTCQRDLSKVRRSKSIPGATCVAASSILPALFRDGRKGLIQLGRGCKQAQSMPSSRPNSPRNKVMKKKIGQIRKVKSTSRKASDASSSDVMIQLSPSRKSGNSRQLAKSS